MNRFLDGDNIDIFILAKNALTSVEMLEKFYLSHAASKMKIKELQSFKDRNKAALFDQHYPDFSLSLYEALGLTVATKGDAVPS
jgi:hypothetical protein